MKRLHYNSKKICCVRQDGLRSIYFYALIQYTCQLGTMLDLFHPQLLPFFSMNSFEKYKNRIAPQISITKPDWLFQSLKDLSLDRKLQLIPRCFCKDVWPIWREVGKKQRRRAAGWLRRPSGRCSSSLGRSHCKNAFFSSRDVNLHSFDAIAWSSRPTPFLWLIMHWIFTDFV